MCYFYLIFTLIILFGSRAFLDHAQDPRVRQDGATVQGGSTYSRAVVLGVIQEPSHAPLGKNIVPFFDRFRKPHVGPQDDLLVIGIFLHI